MDTLDRMLAREFLSLLVLILIGLAVLFLGADFLMNLWHHQGRMPMTRILAMYAYRFPAALQMFFPVACLMATLVVLTTMSRHNEVLALYAGGISALRIATTLIMLVGVLSGASFVVFDAFVPMLNKRHLLISQGRPASDESALTELDRDSLWYRSGNLIYSARRFESGGPSLHGLDVYVMDSGFNLAERIHARQAFFRDRKWVLEDGFSIRYPGDFPIPGTFARLENVIFEEPKDFKTAHFHEETMKIRDLKRYIQHNRGTGLDITAQLVHFHERLALVLAPLVLILISLPYSLRPLRTYSMGKSVGFCFLLVFIYLVMFRFSVSLGKSGNVPPFLAAWTPNLIFLSIALLMVSRRHAA